MTFSHNENKERSDCGRWHSGLVHTAIAAIAIICCISGWLFFGLGNANSQSEPDFSILSLDDKEFSSRGVPVLAKRLFPVTIRKPTGPPRVETGLIDENNNAVTVSCSTCHATRKPNLENKVVADLNEFHSSLSFSHGNVSCMSCHNPDNYDALKLADGSKVEFTDVMTLCAQCHGQQMKDYEHGVHGGMSGYWDLTRGPRTKNNCVDCHNPHAPKFPKMQPTFKPRDRFLEHEGSH